VRKARDEEPLPSPIECCKPHLEANLDTALGYLLLGATAFSAVAGEREGEAGLARSRGFPLVLRGRPAIATFHPAFVLRSRRWTDTFRSDVAKFFRHLGGRLQWTAPRVILDPTLSELDGTLEELSRRAARGSLIGVDTETDGLDPETCNLRCVGLAVSDLGIALGFRSVERPARAFRVVPEIARERLRNFFEMSTGRLAIHNQVYDRPVLARHGMPLLGYDRFGIESLIAHHVLEGELPHDLSYLTSRFLDAPAWKPPDHDSWTSDIELHTYNVIDAANTSALAVRFRDELRAKSLIPTYLSDVRLQELCVGMHRAGMWIDEEERRRHASRLYAKMNALEAEANAILSESTPLGTPVNLRSPQQIRDLLYTEWGLPAPYITDSGEASTNKDALYELLLSALPDHVVRFVELLIDYRAAARTLSKDVLCVGETPSWLAGIDNEERDSGLVIGMDGRVHPYWSAHVVVTGRLACSNPQVANVPDKKVDPDSIRSMYAAPPGKVLVGCDMEQAEFRVVALIAGEEKWLEWFSDPSIDPHKLNAADYFSKSPDTVSKSERSFSKNLTYGLFYGAQTDTLLAQMRKVRDGAARPYAMISREYVDTMRNRVLSSRPALKRWWKTTVERFETIGYISDIVLGRRRYFLDARGAQDVQKFMNEIVNFAIQCTISSLMGGDKACRTVIDEIGWPWTRAGGLGGAGIIHHGHDSLMVEVAEHEAARAKEILEHAMTFKLEYEGRSVLIPSVAKIGKRWSDV